MNGFSVLTPIPAVHFEGVIKILESKDFALLGSESFDVFQNTEIGSKLLIYISHDNAEPYIMHTASFLGIVGEPTEMRRLDNAGFRPPTTYGEKWGFYWKISAIVTLINPVKLSDIKLPSGKYLKSFPRGPIHVIE